jgi:hypothetical protein
MLIELTCSCGKRLQVSAEFAGRQGQCPACGERLEIPKRDTTVTGVVASSGEVAQAVFGAPGLAEPKGRGAPQDAVTPLAGSAADLHAMEGGGPGIKDKEKLTGVGCILTLLSVVVIFAVALPIVRWRDPATGQPLPREVAIVTPLLIGAAVHGIGSLFLKLIGVRVWSKRESEAEGRDSQAI